MTVADFMVADFAQRAIGLPFVDGGRDWDGVDCWGLVTLAYAHVLNVDLPDYGDVPASDALAVRASIRKGSAGHPWRRVSDPEPLDVVLMSVPSSARIGHVGLWAPGRMVMHAQEGPGVACEPARSAAIRDRIIGNVRHVCL